MSANAAAQPPQPRGLRLSVYADDVTKFINNAFQRWADRGQPIRIVIARWA